jgi:hypothetical protein
MSKTSKRQAVSLCNAILDLAHFEKPADIGLVVQQLKELIQIQPVVPVAGRSLKAKGFANPY